LKLLAAASCAAILAAVLPSASGASAVRHAAPKYVYGIDTYVTYNCVSAAQIDGWATTEAKAYKKLGANTIGIGFPIYMPSINSNLIYAKDVCNNQNFQSPSASILGGIVLAAEKVGLKVMIRPLLDQTNLYQENPAYWRGVIAPTSLSTWMSNYLTTLRPYLQMAQQDKVSYFALQTELDSIASAPNWTSAISICKILYKGTLVWNYSWDSAVRKITRPGTTFAVDAYPKLPLLTVTSTTKQIAAGWEGLLKSPPGYQLPNAQLTTMDEVGIAAQDGAYANPANTAFSLKTHPFNQKIQANWFTAACTFMKVKHLQGVYFWGPFLTSNAGKMLSTPTPTSSSNIQPLAQTAIKKCF
jgi:hypothetical protein